MTAREIQRRLISDLYRESFVIMNYTPARWFECDVAEITDGGFLIEYEIKISRSDFFADAKKLKEKIEYGHDGVVNGRPQWNRRVVAKDTKHELLADPVRALSASFNVPKQFWFVVPEGMLKHDEIPAWAGLIEARTYEQNVFLHWHDKRPAKQLHSQKLPLKIKEHAKGVCYWRMHHYFLKHTKPKEYNAQSHHPI